MKIENNEASFDISEVGDVTLDTYMGTFKVKCVMSPLEEIAADRRYRELLGDNYHLAQEHVRQKAFALTQLSQRIIQAPPFWDNNIIGGGHVVDDNVVFDVLDKAIEAQKQYMDSKKQELKDRQQKITDMIKKKNLEKEPELDTEKANNNDDIEEEDGEGATEL